MTCVNSVDTGSTAQVFQTVLKLDVRHQKTLQPCLAHIPLQLASPLNYRSACCSNTLLTKHFNSHLKIANIHSQPFLLLNTCAFVWDAMPIIQSPIQSHKHDTSTQQPGTCLKTLGEAVARVMRRGSPTKLSLAQSHHEQIWIKTCSGRNRKEVVVNQICVLFNKKKMCLPCISKHKNNTHATLSLSDVATSDLILIFWAEVQTSSLLQLLVSCRCSYRV